SHRTVIRSNGGSNRRLGPSTHEVVPFVGPLDRVFVKALPHLNQGSGNEFSRNGPSTSGISHGGDECAFVFAVGWRTHDATVVEPVIVLRQTAHSGRRGPASAAGSHPDRGAALDRDPAEADPGCGTRRRRPGGGRTSPDPPRRPRRQR